jgi:hypothetical protein
MFAGLEPIIHDFSHHARIKTETLRTDKDIFEVWSNLVTAGERLASFKPVFTDPDSETEKRRASFGTQLICNGRDLIFYITRARVAMPKSTTDFVARCKTYAEKGTVDVMPVPLPG